MILTNEANPDGEQYWLIESGLTDKPYYFCMAFKNGQPEWSSNPFDAVRFKSKERATAVSEEWDLTNIRICLHGFYEN